MISTILPYWDRQAVADRSLALMAMHYAGLDMEIVVVDDGNAVPYVAPKGMPFPVRVIRLPVKHEPRNPCVPINLGVHVAAGDVIALSGPDIMHVRPVLPAMLEELNRGGENAYVIAAVWAPEHKGRGRWHVHSSMTNAAQVEGVPLPKGAHYHFMTMLRRSLWEASGGLDPDYREGTGYDDPDFVLRLARAGAKFVIRDDLVVEHIRGGAHASWTKEQFERNRRLFISKWGGARVARQA